MTRLPALVLLAALGACSRDAPPPVETATAPPAVEPAAPVAPAAPPPTPTLPSIPARFRGEWNTDTAACGTPIESRLVLGPTAVQYYESSGTVRTAEERGDDLVLAVALAGEGETFERTYRYRLSADGNALTDLDAAVSRTRCPAG